MQAADSTDLRIVDESRAGGHRIRLSGTIDLNFPRARLVELAREVVVFDLEEVQRITSYGVREWIKTLRELRADYYCFVNCRPAVIMQFNLVAGFAGRGELLSFYLPYVCPDCDTYEEVLMDVRANHGDLRAFSVPRHTCRACGADAEFDDAPESYLSYAAKAKAPAPPPLVEAILSGQAVAATPFRVEKHISDSITAIWLSGTLDTTARLKRLADGVEGKVILLLGGVSGIVPKALAQLRPFFEASTFECYLARITPAVARILTAAGPDSLGRVQVATVRVPCRCSACGAVSELELDALALRELGTRPEPAHTCPSCGAAAVMVPDAEGLAAVSALKISLVPPEVLSYLAEYQAPPEAEGIAAAPTISSSAIPVITAGPRSSGRYEIIRRLGNGGMAEVFLAKQTSVGGFAKRVVLKRIHPHLSSDEEFVAMFLEEAKLAARIAHPNVTEVYDIWQEGSEFVTAMEYVRGWDLNVVLRTCKDRNESLPVGLAAYVVSQICAGLHAAHTCSDESGRPLMIVHRDVSPHNVLVASSGQVKISDFGIAKAADGSSRTPSNQLKGKLAYMAPEQARDGTVDARSDIFPAGLILYQCLTLEHMFERASDFATFQAILNDPIPPLTQKRPGVPPELQQVLEKATARDPAQRYQTARAMAEDLEQLMSRLEGRPSAAELSEWLLPRMPAIEETPDSGSSPRRITSEQTLVRDRSQS